MYYARKFSLSFNLLRFETVSLSIKTIGPCSPCDIARFGSVPGYTAVLPDLLKGNPLSVLSHDHGKARRTALKRFHLHYDGNLCYAICHRLFDPVIT